MPDFSIADILARGYQQRAPLLAQPYGLSNVAPVAGNVAQAGFGAMAQREKNQSILQAQKDYADYLAKVDSGAATQADHQKGYQAALSLGITPKTAIDNQVDPRITSELQKLAGVDGALRGTKENVAGLEKTAALKKQTKSSYAELTPEEQKAIDLALDSGRLNPKQIVRGPKLKALAKQFIQNPSYNAAQAEIGFGAALSGAEAGARLTGGGDAQKSARAAQTVKLLLPGLLKASQDFNRTDIRAANKAISVYDEQTGGTKAMTFNQYITDMRTKMSVALQGGGTPTDRANAMVSDAFPNNITPDQVPAAVRNIEDIMNTQIRGALTPVTVQDAGKTAPAAKSPAPSKSSSDLLDKYGVP